MLQDTGSQRARHALGPDLFPFVYPFFIKIDFIENMLCKQVKKNRKLDINSYSINTVIIIQGAYLFIGFNYHIRKGKQSSRSFSHKDKKLVLQDFFHDDTWL